VPVTDVTTSSICLNQEELGRHAAIAVPPFHAFELVTDKAALLRSARDCGVPIPRTLFTYGLPDLHRVAHLVEYPAVVKPARSRILTGRGWVATSVQYAHSAADLWRLYERTPYLASYPSLIQQRVVGSGVGLFVLFDQGQLVAAFAHRRLREKPPSGGVSVLCESVPVDPRLRDDALRLLGPLGWHGVAMLEYKQEGTTGDRFLMEVNGRFWGSLELAVDAGVDFPYLIYQLALGTGPDVSPTYRAGVKNRWFLGDLDHLLLRLFKRDGDLSLPAAAPSRFRTVIEWLTCTLRGVHDQVLGGDDPRPFFYELRQWANSLGASERSSPRPSIASRAVRGSLLESPER
jgi:predicted ATP-grasp superfamily ATP-dependent carboligase